MSKLIECDKCKELKNVFGISHLIEESLGIKAVLCHTCTENFHRALEDCRKDLIGKFLRQEKTILHGKKCKKCAGPLSYFYETDTYVCVVGCGNKE